MRATVEIDAGVCGFKTAASARSLDGQNVSFEVQTDCEKIGQLAATLSGCHPLDAYQEINAARESVLLATVRNTLKGCCAGCAVPAGLFKAMQVAAGLALPKDISMKRKPMMSDSLCPGLRAFAACEPYEQDEAGVAAFAHVLKKDEIPDLSMGLVTLEGPIVKTLGARDEWDHVYWCPPAGERFAWAARGCVCPSRPPWSSRGTPFTRSNSRPARRFNTCTSTGGGKPERAEP